MKTARRRVVLITVAVLLIVGGGGTVALYVAAQRSRPGDAQALRTPSAGVRPTGPNGGVMQGPSHPPVPTGVACTYTPADRGQGDARLAETPAPRATLTGRVTANLNTGIGVISIELRPDRAPCTVNSFVSLARQDYYSDTDCHRLTTDGLWILQCGDPTGTGTGTPGYEFGEENVPTGSTPAYPRGTVAMANAGPGTNGGQFFIVYRDSAIPPAYSVFGTVTAGLDLIEQVAAAGTENGTADGRPRTPVHIDEITVAS